MKERSDTAASEIPGHYIQRSPGGITGIVAVVAALVLLAYAVAEVRRGGQNEPTLSLVSGLETGKDVPVLQVTSEGYLLEKQPVSTGDIEFRLSGAAGRAQGLVVEYPEDLPVADLTQALDLVNRAGFVQVGLRTTAGDGMTTSAQ